MLCATLLAAWPLAGRAAQAGLAVSMQQDQDATVRVRVRGGSGQEPDLAWSGTAQPAPYRLALAWQGAPVSLEQPLPSKGLGSVQTLALRSTDDQTRLELQINRAVNPSLRRVADGWELRLEPAGPPPVAAAATPAPAPPQPPAKPEAPMQIARLTVREPVTHGRRPEPEPLLLEMTVNGQRQPNVARAELWPDGALLVAGEAWVEARLSPPPEQRALSDGTPAFALEALRDLRYRIDRSSQSLEINAPASAFVASSLQMKDPAPAAPEGPAAPGVMLNYDVAITRSGRGAKPTSGATVELVASGPYGNLVNSALITNDEDGTAATRLDSYWRYDMPRRMQSLVVGDTVGSGGGWSRPARYAGVRWGRNFGLRPGFIALPQLALSGQAALPSTVDVLVNNVQRISQPVQPGPFDVPNVPVVTGAGEVNLIVRDLLGRETIVRQSYYASPRLLEPGLTDFSLEAGWLRTGYGRDSAYGDLFAAGTMRAGLSNAMTGEARIELEKKRQAAGVELAGVVGTWGAGRVALAASRGNASGGQERGYLLQLSAERQTPLGGATVQYERASRGFAPFGEPADPAAPGLRSREQWLGGVSGRLWGAVSAGVNYVRQTRWNGDQVASLGLSLSAPLGEGASLSAAVNKRLDDGGGWSAGVQVSLPLEHGTHLSGRVDRLGDGEWVASAAAARGAPAGTGVGWRVEGSTQASQRARGALQYNGEHGEIALDLASDADGQLAARAAARGTVGWVAGVPFASRPVGEGSVAVVQVDGVAGVPVKRSNHVVAHTDSRGLAFVSGLVPWHRNEIEIDPADLPMDVEMRDATRTVVPHARSGALVRFEVRRSRQALVVLHRADGTPVPVGAQVRLLPDGPQFLAGRRGEVWLTDIAAGTQRVQVSWSAGSCELELPQAPYEEGPQQLGPLTCGGMR